MRCSSLPSDGLPLSRRASAQEFERRLPLQVLLSCPGPGVNHAAATQKNSEVAWPRQPTAAREYQDCHSTSQGVTGHMLKHRARFVFLRQWKLSLNITRPDTMFYFRRRHPDGNGMFVTHCGPLIEEEGYSDYSQNS
jgi:hypothetical protein